MLVGSIVSSPHALTCATELRSERQLSFLHLAPKFLYLGTQDDLRQWQQSLFQSRIVADSLSQSSVLLC